MPEEGRSRRSDTVWRRRSLGLTTQGKPGTEGFRLKYFRTRHLLGNGASIRKLDRRLPQSVPSYRHVALRMVPRVIATALCL
jgi:hypothetical protein